nr:hypothetical protein CFP56_48839 [Quercus suber]
MQRDILFIIRHLQHLLDRGINTIFEVFLGSSFSCTVARLIKTSMMAACPYLAAICKGVSPLTLACRSSGGHISRISSTKAVDNSESSGSESFDSKYFDIEYFDSDSFRLER